MPHSSKYLTNEAVFSLPGGFRDSTSNVLSWSGDDGRSITGVLRRRAHVTIAISHASIVAPFLLGSATALWVYPKLSHRGVPFGVFALFMGVAMSVTAFPVLARILTDRGIQRTRLGVIALACAAVDDVTAWCLLALVSGVAVTVIEASLILSMVIAGGIEQAAVPRDTIYAALMIICNGVVGVCLLVGGWHHREQSFRVEGANSGLAALIPMAALTLVLPAFTTTTPKPDSAMITTKKSNRLQPSRKKSRRYA